MGAWSPQTLRVARPSAERLSEVGTVPMHAPVLSDGTERFQRAVLGLICYKWGPGRLTFATSGGDDAWLGPLRVPPEYSSLGWSPQLVLARFQMLGKDGGFGVRSLVDDGEYSQLAMISEYRRGRVAGDKH